MGRLTTAKWQTSVLDCELFASRMSFAGAILFFCMSMFLLSPATVTATELVDSTRYIVGPGDEFTVSFTEARIASFVTVVGVEGAATIDGVGTFSIAGLTLSEAKAMLLLGLEKRFAGSGPELGLTTVRKKRTLVAGAVVSPGLYETKATALVSDLIAKAGGLVKGASRRNIEIRAAANSASYPVDLEMFTLVGDPNSNPAVYLGDVIYVSLFSDSTQRIYVSGQVRSARWIEFTQRDDVMDLIRLAGGLTGVARSDSALLYESIAVVESASANRVQRSMISLSDSKTLAPGSRVIVLSVGANTIDKDVSISGAVKNPGRYPYEEGLTIAKLVAIAGGTIAESYDAGTTIFNRSNEHGAVANSMFTAENNAIRNANVFAPEGRLSANNVRSGLASSLEPGDSVVVPFAEGFVSVLGQVKAPGLVIFDSNLSAFDYINLAGGSNSWADTKGSFVTRKISQGALPLSSADRIYDGDIIFVAKKHEKGGSGTLGWLRDVTLIGAGVALTVFAIDKVGN